MTDHRPTLSQILRSVDTTENSDTAYIVAAAMNLYIEANRRLKGQVLLGPADVKAVFDMVFILIDERDHAPIADTARTRALTPEEEQKLLKGIEELRPQR